MRGAAKPPLQLPAYACVYEVLPRGCGFLGGAACEPLRYADCVVCVHVILRVSFVTNVLIKIDCFGGCFDGCCLLTCGRCPWDVSSGTNVANTLESIRRLRPPSTAAPNRVSNYAIIRTLPPHAGVAGGRRVVG